MSWLLSYRLAVVVTSGCAASALAASPEERFAEAQVVFNAAKEQMASASDESIEARRQFHESATRFAALAEDGVASVNLYVNTGNAWQRVFDFGTSDGYVGAMHGVVLGINAGARIVDITHDIARQNLREAAFVLYTVYPHFPDGTIHVVVVDPGVGSERRAIALRTEKAQFVAPDNGVLSYVVAKEQSLEMVELSNPDYWLPQVSATFHGRDVFSPVAAHLSLGVPLSDLGPSISGIATFPLPEPSVQPDGIVRGHVLHVDRFGNLITDIRPEVLANTECAQVEIGSHLIKGIDRTYAVAAPGALVALIGSAGHLEIAVREGDAAALLGVAVGAEVVVTPQPPC